MAYVKISAWEIAEAFGLCFEGLEEYTDKYGDVNYGYKFGFHDKAINRNKYMYDNSYEAKERVAEDLLYNLGKHLSKVIGDI